MIERKNLAPIGKFLKTHALKGELNAQLTVDDVYIAEGNPLIVDIDGIFVPFYAESVRPKGATTFLIKLEGIESEEEARKMVNREIFTPKENLSGFYSEDGEEIVFEDDLIGYEVVDTNSGPVGRVEEVNDSTQNVLLICTTPDGEEVYIPFTDDFVEEIDDDAKRISMKLPEGILHINARKSDEEKQ